MPRDAEPTRRRILSVALTLFREHGFAKTTMRRIAKEAGLSLGAAYHHFDGKQAIVQAYYEQQSEAHERRAREAVAKADGGLRERVGLYFHTGLDVRATDRALMRELAPLVVGPEEATSAFSRDAAELRDRSIALLRELVEDPSVPEDLRDPLALGLWALFLGILLYFTRDESPRQRKTRALIDGALDLVVVTVGALAMPPFAPVRARLATLLRDAELLD